MALPKIPVSTLENMNWNDTLPYNVLFGRRTNKLFVAAFSKKIISIKGEYKLSDNFAIEGTIFTRRLNIKTFVKLNQRKGIDEIKIEQKSKIITIKRTG